MKTFSVLVNLAVLQSSVLSQVQGNVQNSTQEEELKAQALVQQEALPPQASAPNGALPPANLPVNSVGFTDTNREGFNPFAIAKGPNHTGAKVFLGTMTIASVIAPLVMIEPWGIAAAILLQGIAMLFQPTPPNPGQIYQAIYGRIQNQINTAINNKDVSEKVDNLQTLSIRLNDQTVVYLALL